MTENSTTETKHTTTASSSNFSSLKPLWLVLLYLVLAAYGDSRRRDEKLRIWVCAKLSL
ncbi:MAG: hypothetical protein QF913_06600 [Nitrospinaceae bacterium]|jgi:hypothetical protein|nr:hypothetical protein [Nitrospinaceae bacterium]